MKRTQAAQSLDYLYAVTIANLLAVLFPGGLAAFREQGGAMAIAGDVLYVYHPAFPDTVWQSIRKRLTQGRMDIKVVATPCFASVAARDGFTEALTLWLNEQKMHEVVCSINACVATLTIVAARCSMARIAKLESWLRAQGALARYAIMYRDTCAQWDRGVDRVAFAGKVCGLDHAIGREELFRVRYMLSEMGNNVDDFIAHM